MYICLMDIKYKNKATEKECTQYRQALKQYNKEVAEKIIKCINYIENASTFSDIINYPPFHLHPLKADRVGEFAIDLGRKLGFRLIIEPLDNKGKSLGLEKDYEIIKQCTKIILVVEVTNHYE